MSVFSGLFTSRETQSQDLNRVQYGVQQAFIGLGRAFTQALAAAFGTTPTGAVTVTLTNAPTGSPAQPARYVTMSDGKGGTYTFPSLT